MHSNVHNGFITLSNIFTGSTLLGISGTVAQYLFQKRGFSPEWLVVIRLLVTGLILLLYAFTMEHKDIWKCSNSNNTSMFIASDTYLLFSYPYKKIPNSREIIAIILAMLGTFFIITIGDILSISISKLAVFWGISSAFTSAFYILQPRDLLTRWSSTLVVGWVMLIGGIAFSFIHQPWNFSDQYSITSILAVIFVVLFGTLVAFYCYLESLKYIHPTETSVLSCVEPLSAALLSVL